MGGDFFFIVVSRLLLQLYSDFEKGPPHFFGVGITRNSQHSLEIILSPIVASKKPQPYETDVLIVTVEVMVKSLTFPGHTLGPAPNERKAPST